MDLAKISAGRQPPDEINVIVEIPQGGPIKYELDKGSGALFVDRFLGTAMVYPGNYGFIPQTLAEDGDPLDVLVLISEPLDVGVMLEVAPIGMLKMRDEKGEDDKVLAVATHDRTYREVRDLEHVADDELRLIEHFFRTYKTLEHKDVVSQGWLGRSHAYALIQASCQRYTATPHP